MSRFSPSNGLVLLLLVWLVDGIFCFLFFEILLFLLGKLKKGNSGQELTLCFKKLNSYVFLPLVTKRARTVQP